MGNFAENLNLGNRFRPPLGGGRGQSAPLRFFTGKVLLAYREKRGKEKAKMENKRRKICRRMGGKFETDGKNEKREMYEV